MDKVVQGNTSNIVKSPAAGQMRSGREAVHDEATRYVMDYERGTKREGVCNPDPRPSFEISFQSEGSRFGPGEAKAGFKSPVSRRAWVVNPWLRCHGI